MKPFPEKFVECFRRVRRINEFYWLNSLNPGDIPVSIEDLQWAIEGVYGVRVEKYAVDVKNDFVRAMYERYEDGTVKIYVQRELPNDWLRYLTAKELCHAVIDEPEDFEAKGCETIEHLIRAQAMHVIDNSHGADVRSEKLAEIMAVEFLYPHEFRRADASALLSKEVTPAQLSGRYGLPEFLISWVLRSEHLDLCDVMWRAATADKTAAE